MTRIQQAVWALLVGGLLALPLAHAQESDRDFHWKGRLNGGQVVEIKGVHGEIRAEGASGDQVEVTATKSGADASLVRIEVAQSTQGVTICAVYPSEMVGHSNRCEPGGEWHTNTHGSIPRVDFSVNLPRNLRFRASNVNGSITAEGLGKQAEARTVNGSIHLSTREWGSARTVNGSISARLGSSDWTGTLNFATVNGRIEVELPGDLNAEFRAATVNGRIESDFPLTVKGTIGGRKVEGTIGSGGRELVLKTVNGGIRSTKAAACSPNRE